MVIKTLYHFVDSNLGAEISSKKRSKQKMWGGGGGQVFNVGLPGKRANDRPWGRKGLLGETKGWGKLY